MGQQEIIETLENSKVPLSLREICDLLGEECERKVSMRLKTLVDYGEVKVIKLHKDLAMKFYKSKRGLRLYYL